MEKETSLTKAINVAGSQAALGEKIGASQQLISHWVRNKKELRAEHAVIVEREFGISRHELLPHIFGPQPESVA